MRLRAQTILKRRGSQRERLDGYENATSFDPLILKEERNRLAISFSDRLASRSTLKDSTQKLAIKLPASAPRFKCWKVGAALFP